MMSQRKTQEIEIMERAGKEKGKSERLLNLLNPKPALSCNDDGESGVLASVSAEKGKNQIIFPC